MHKYQSYERELKKILIHMGITPNYRGYDYIVLAIQLSFENPARLQYVTKELYPVIGKEYHTDWRAVEHSIRITILRSWESDPTRFEKFLGMRNKEKPSAGKFLAVLYAYLLIEFEEEAIKIISYIYLMITETGG